MSLSSSLWTRARLCRFLLSSGAVCLGLLLTAPFCAGASARSNSGRQPTLARSPWVATWGAAMTATDPGDAPDFSDQTLRQIVHTSVAGQQARVWLSNRFGTQPLHVGAAHLAVTAPAHANTGASAASGNSTDSRESDDAAPDESAIQPESDRTLTFHHMSSVVIPPGATIVSDPVALDIPALSNVSVSLYFPDHTLASTEHSSAQQVSYRATGNAIATPDLTGKSAPIHSWYVLQGIDVAAPGNSAVVAYGDSITDGAYATVDENHRWPDDLAVRLAADPAMQKAGVLGVVNAGIGGNRVLLDGYGPNAVARFDWDVLARSGARSMIVLESINDIGRYQTDHQPYGDLAERLKTGLAQLATQAHQHGIRVFGATITPYQGCGYYSEGGEQVRQAVNQWIRTAHTFDGVVDFDKAVRDPKNPLRFAPQYDSGDHLHPRDAGYKAMADSIDLSLFTPSR